MNKKRKQDDSYSSVTESNKELSAEFRPVRKYCILNGK